MEAHNDDESRAHWKRCSWRPWASTLRISSTSGPAAPREAALRAVLEGLPDATVAAGRDGRIVFVNAHAETLFGYEHDELLGQPVQTLWPEAVRDALHAQHAALLRDRASAAVHDPRRRPAPRRHRVRGRDELGDRRDRGGPAAARDRARHDRAPRGDGAAAAPVAPGGRGRRRWASGRCRAPTSATWPSRRSSGCARRSRSTLVVIRRDGELLAALGARRRATLARFEIASGDEVFGEICVRRARSARTRRTSCAAIANVLATALGRLRGEERMRHDALHDPLTGLANRALCRERLIHALARTGRDEGVGLRAVHRPRRLQGRQRPLRARRGRRAADRARRAGWCATVRPADTVARLGGDEFVVVCEDIDEHTAIALGAALGRGDPRAAGRRRDRAPAVGVDRDRAGRGGPARPGRAAGRRRRRGLPREGRGPRAGGGLRHAAAPARARAAADGGGAGAGAVARASCGWRSSRSWRWRDRRVVGHEALLRWDSPGGVMSAPADFIPVAEESALIVEIGAWTLMQACHESAAAFGPGEDGPAIWVNLSRAPARAARPAGAGRGLPGARAGCRRGGCGSSSRSACCRARRRRRGATSRRCGSSGVGLALDDFGTGYSSLRDLPVRAVKIDRSFVAALGRQPGRRRRSWPRSSRWPRALGIDAIAEGVENEEQAAQLRGARVPVRAGLPVRRARPADNLRAVTTFEELDALSVPRAARPRRQARRAAPRREVLLAADVGGTGRRGRRRRPRAGRRRRSRTGAARCSTCCAATRTRWKRAARSTSTTCVRTLGIARITSVRGVVVQVVLTRGRRARRRMLRRVLSLIREIPDTSTAPRGSTASRWCRASVVGDAGPRVDHHRRGDDRARASACTWVAGQLRRVWRRRASGAAVAGGLRLRARRAASQPRPSSRPFARDGRARGEEEHDAVVGRADRSAGRRRRGRAPRRAPRPSPPGRPALTSRHPEPAGSSRANRSGPATVERGGSGSPSSTPR